MLLKDKDIRDALNVRLNQEYGSDPGSTIRNEVGLCNHQRRIDVALINQELTGYEIKSDCDSLSRLTGQSELYGRVLDRVNLVTTDSHLNKAKKIIPGWRGIIIARRGGDVIELEDVRSGSFNPCLDPESIAYLLWREDILKELRRRKIGKGQYQFGKYILVKILIESLSLDEIRELSRNRIKKRSFL